MSIVDVEATVNLRDVENGLRRMQLAGMDLQPVWRAVRKAVRADMREHQKDRMSSSGSWPRLAAATLLHRKARKGKQGRKRRRPLNARSVKPLGRLPGAAKIVISPRSLKLVSRVSWSGAHQLGDRVGRGARIPGREYYWAGPKLLAIVHNKAIDHMTGAWEGRKKV